MLFGSLEASNRCCWLGGDWNEPTIDGPPDQIYVNTTGNSYGSEYNEANGWYVLDDTPNSNITVDPDNPFDYRNRTWKRTTNTGYEFVIQYTATGTSWYIVCEKHPTVVYEYDLYMSKSPANATSPWLITTWEDRSMGGEWQNIITLDDPNVT